MTTASDGSSGDNPHRRILRLLRDFNARPYTRRRHRRCSNCFSSASDYHRLTQRHLLGLSVLKLDGSSFEVQVARSATVADLKLAVERVFDQAPDRQQQLNISWSHVWGHFCLCYHRRKLTNDKASLHSFAINDGDQLHFIRHLSMNYGPAKISLKAHANASSKQGVSLREMKLLKKSLENEKELEHADNGGNSKDFRNRNEQSVDVRRHGEFSLAHFLH